MQHRSRPLVICLAAVIALVISACGSDVPPRSFVEANAFNNGGSNNGANGGNSTNQAGPNGSTTSSAPASSGALPGGNGSTNTGSNGTNGTNGTNGGSNGGQTSSGGQSLGVTAGSCSGFQNATGITSSTITLANASDISGPVSGLFTSAQQATKAYAAYFNSFASVCGRHLKIENLDSETSSVGDQQAATSACSDAFAMVGSMSAFDLGGAKTVTDCGIPDLRAITVNSQRTAAPVSYGTDSINVPQVSTSQYSEVESARGALSKKAAVLYLDAGASTPNAMADIATLQHMGFEVDKSDQIPLAVTSFNYAPDVAKLMNDKVTFVQFVGAYQYGIKLKQAIDQQGLKLTYFMDSVAYDPNFAVSGASDVNGTYAFVDTALFEEQSSNPEMQLYLKWLHLVAPGANPSFFGLFAWGAMKLFTQLAVQLGGKLTRASLLTGIRGTSNYTANGLFAPQNVGQKRTSGCQALIQLENGVWVRRSPAPFTCGPVFDTGG